MASEHEELCGEQWPVRRSDDRYIFVCRLAKGHEGPHDPYLSETQVRTRLAGGTSSLKAEVPIDPPPASALREALDKAKALVVHWTTFRDSFHSLDPMPQEAQEQYPEWGWYRAKDVKAFVAEVEAALRASEAS